MKHWNINKQFNKFNNKLNKCKIIINKSWKQFQILIINIWNKSKILTKIRNKN